MSHADEKNCRYCHGTGWKKDGFGGEMPCAGDPSVEQPSTPPLTIDDFKKWKAEPVQTGEAKPVQPWMERVALDICNDFCEDEEYVAQIANHIASHAPSSSASREELQYICDWLGIEGVDMANPNRAETIAKLIKKLIRVFSSVREYESAEEFAKRINHEWPTAMSEEEGDESLYIFANRYASERKTK